MSLFFSLHASRVLRQGRCLILVRHRTDSPWRTWSIARRVMKIENTLALKARLHFWHTSWIDAIESRFQRLFAWRFEFLGRCPRFRHGESVLWRTMIEGRAFSAKHTKLHIGLKSYSQPSRRRHHWTNRTLSYEIDSQFAVPKCPPCRGNSIVAA